MHKKKSVVQTNAHDISSSVEQCSFKIQEFLKEHKIFDIVTIDLQGKTAIADLMIVASGRSQKHISVTAELLHDYLKQKNIKFISIEGLPHSDWILLDAGDIIVHLFKPEVRALYNLEKMWNVDIKAVDQNDLLLRLKNRMKK